MKLSLKFDSGGWQLKSNLYMLIFALALGAGCALLLTAAAELTYPYRTANAQAEEIMNVLNVLKVPLPEDTSPSRLIEVFNTNIIQQTKADLPFYSYVPENKTNQPEAYAIQFTGQGLWGAIKGFLALESDMKTIRGITFYQQEETPGLGGEIASPWFQQQFIGKTIVNNENPPGIIIQSDGNKLGVNSVDAITGATMTCDKVQSILNEAIDKVVKEF
jgi:Na+-transporting NADH:ubiquinone oxidoreductase subunit C